MTDVVPPIRAGLIDPATGGARLPEFAVRTDGAPGRLDEMFGGGFVILSADSLEMLDLTPVDAARWAAISWPPIQLTASEIGLPRDEGGRFAAWLASQSAYAVIVRPDRYIYGAATSASDLRRLVLRLLEQVLGQTDTRTTPGIAMP
jgi:3-(3-hydroxy-phenyl)propionate hydroxylase